MGGCCCGATPVVATSPGRGDDAATGGPGRGDEDDGPGLGEGTDGPGRGEEAIDEPGRGEGTDGPGRGDESTGRGVVGTERPGADPPPPVTVRPRADNLSMLVGGRSSDLEIKENLTFISNAIIQSVHPFSLSYPSL
jgi:hypothetical protein